VEKGPENVRNVERERIRRLVASGMSGCPALGKRRRGRNRKGGSRMQAWLAATASMQQSSEGERKVKGGSSEKSNFSGQVDRAKPSETSREVKVREGATNQ
jgi:hypothetical protein